MALFGNTSRLLQQAVANLGTIVTYLGTIISNQKEILKLMATGNVTIQQLSADFGKFQTDFSKFAGDQSALLAALKTFLANLSSGAGGSTLSQADQSTLNTLDSAITAADSTLQSMDQAVAAIQIPPAAPASGTGSGSAPAGS